MHFVDAGEEAAVQLGEIGEQPDGGEAPAHDQQVILGQLRQQLDQQRPFAVLVTADGGLDHQLGSGCEQAQSAGQHRGLTVIVPLDAERLLVFQPIRQREGGGIGRDQAPAPPARFGCLHRKRAQQALVQRLEDGGFQFLAGLGQRAFGDGAADLAGQGLEELIEQGLQAALPGAQQESDEDGEGDDAVASEIFRVDAMLGDEGGIVERLREIGEDCDMDTAKSVSYFILIYQ